MKNAKIFKLKKLSITFNIWQWNAREKLMVVFYHENGHSIRATASKYEIEPKQVRDWKNKKIDLIRAAPYVQRLNTGARPKYPLLEEELLQWFRELRDQLVS